MKNYTAFQAGKKPFTPAQLTNLALWLPTSAYSITTGTLNGADQSGHGSNCTQGSTNTTIVPASSGVPAHLAFPGFPNSSQLIGTWASAIPAGAPFTCYVLRQMINPSTKGGLWFAYSQNSPTFNVVADSVGGGRFIANNVGAAQSLVFPDVSTGWVIDIVQQDGANNGQILRGNTVEASGAFNNQGLQTGGSYLVGGQNGFGQDDPRNLAEVILDLNFDSAPTIAKVVSFLLARIPP